MRRLVAVSAASIVLLTGCGGTSDPSDAPTTTASLQITAVAGPVCPVQTDPPSPECAPRPVDAALIVVTDSEGSEVARGTTGPDGIVVVDVAPGELIVVPQPVEGLLGTAEAVVVTATGGRTLPITVEYDTGIR